MQAIKSIHATKNNHFLPQILFQVILLCLLALPAYLNLQSVQTIKWPAFLLLTLFQFLLTHVYFLFSKQKKLSLVKNIVVLGIFEVAMILIMLFSPFTILVKGLLFLQWILIHLVIGTQNLLPILPPLFIAMELVIMQNIMEMANANVLLTGLGFVPFLFYLGTFSWLASLFMDRHSIGIEIAGKKSSTQKVLSILRLVAVVILIIAIALSFITDAVIFSRAIALTVSSLVLCIYGLYLKRQA
ncbi:hypothetical protein EF384_01600 [Aerococcus agrisoli]|uniref:Uncharacterized protein n=1 Tax=Aerococcus agrisoli TaxID=2487350 RepID=A0A3N4GLC9_9LACT|nr:hypothetical protein [Aerococcus agrisoli]RPA63642.1 hypothetical protein EF384_01600 [Aerococcus agrisoli]